MAAVAADDAAGGVASIADLATAPPLELFRRSAQLVLGLDWATALDVVDWYLGQKGTSSVEGGWDLEALRHLCTFYYNERKWTLLILRKLFDIDRELQNDEQMDVVQGVVHPHFNGAVLNAWKRVDAEKTAVWNPLSTGAESFVGDLLQLCAAGLPNVQHGHPPVAEIPGEVAFANFWRHTALNTEDAGAHGSGFLATAQRLRVRASLMEPRIAAYTLSFFFASESCRKIVSGGYCNVVVASLAEIYGTPRRPGLIQRLGDVCAPAFSQCYVAQSALSLVTLSALRLDVLSGM